MHGIALVVWKVTTANQLRRVQTTLYPGTHIQCLNRTGVYAEPESKSYAIDDSCDAELWSPNCELAPYDQLGCSSSSVRICKARVAEYTAPYTALYTRSHL